MPGPLPTPASKRQRRNRTTTAATLEAPPASRVDLPPHRVSDLRCAACPRPSWHHTKAAWMREERESEDFVPEDVHDYIPRPLEWRQATRDWWAIIWASPIADEWVDADVPNLLALAVLVDQFWTNGDRGVHAEMRQAMREFGLSPLSRRQLQWEVKKLAAVSKPAAAPAPTRKTTRSLLSVLEGRAG